MHLKNGCWFRHVNEGPQINNKEKVIMKSHKKLNLVKKLKKKNSNNGKHDK